MISLYSGIGGLDSGFASVGFEPLMANDIDAKAESTYRAVLDSVAEKKAADEHRYMVGDISEDFAELAANEDAIVVGGPPCQGFSRAGRMDPNDERSRHVRRFMEAVAAVRPRAFVMENVAALATNERWIPVLRAVRRSAQKSGYATALIVLDAADYGVPQSRKRMFLMGIRDGNRRDLQKLRTNSPRCSISVRKALEEVQHFQDQPDSLKCAAKITPAARPVLRTSPFAGMPFNGQGRFLNLDSIAPTISASLGGNHTPIVDQAWLDSPQEGGASIRRYMDALRVGKMIPIESSWRRLSVPEAARLQGFSTEIDWVLPRSVAFRQIGNAVPPPLAAEVAKRLARALGATPATSKQGDIAA
ncbi:DNA cytosine methyltransferase [Curtobacterium sp. ER1/6]|uniref:DNA cytosine methyltransferase n=1 Tax=Curtobacterium sp. ER1/6 TaxID=1891920 RepID=UPI001CB8F3A8|nr:DNA cytosine methyltransferase [Curtobacterium sp. ER1/6]